MEWRSEPTEAEELSFGGDTDREPRLSAWVRSHTRAVIVAMSAVVLLAALGAGGWFLYRQSRLPEDPPAGPWPRQVKFVVDMCGGRRPYGSCPDGDPATTRQVRAVEEKLRTLPDVTGVTFIGRDEAYAKVVAFYRAEGDAVDIINKEAFADSFEGELRSPEVFARVAHEVGSLPGVGVVRRAPISFWLGKADVSVEFCTATLLNENCGEGPASERQKQAVLDRLHDLAGVRTVYFADRAHGLKERRAYVAGGPEDGATMREEDVPECFYVKLDDPGQVRSIQKALEKMPGVLTVWPVSM